MGMQRRSWRGFWAMGLAALMALGGCSGKNPAVHEAPPEEARTVITFFGNKYEPENVTVIEEIISGFMKENPTIRVSYESLKGRDYYEALRKRMAAGKGDDVFIVDHDTVLELGACLLYTSQLDRELAQASEKIQDMVNAIPGGVAIYKVADTFETTYFSDGVAELTGYSVEAYRQVARDAGAPYGISVSYTHLVAPHTGSVD